MKRPAFQFYPADWRKDAALQSCSLSAQGLWVNMLCIAHECEPYGHLVVNGKPINAAQLARLVGLGATECAKLLAELEDAGVTSKSESGAIFSRRMVRDEELREKRAACGQAGAEHGIKGAEYGAKGGRPRKGRGVLEPPKEPPPSSSSSPSGYHPLPPQGGRLRADRKTEQPEDPNEAIQRRGEAVGVGRWNTGTLGDYRAKVEAAEAAGLGGVALAAVKRVAA